LKPDDPAWADLATEIESVVSHRFVEDPAASWRPFYIPSEGEPGFAFASLNREDRLDLLADLVSWRDYECQGISHEQQRIVIANVLDGKPQEKWLEGVFDEAVLENQKIDSFKTFVEIMKLSPDNHVFEEIDGDHRPWAKLSAAAKLQYIALDAARCDVGFEPFAQVVKDTIGVVGEAALRVVLDGQKELHAIAELFPDDGRTEPTPLVEQVKDMLDYVSALETQEKERGQVRETRLEGMEGAKASDGILPEGVAFSERNEDVLTMAGTNRSAPKAEPGTLSLRDLRPSQEQERRGEDQRRKSKEMER